jgi:hypothetical protein
MITLVFVIIAPASCVTPVEADQEHRRTGHGCHIDRSIEGYREPRFNIEAVEGVDDGEILAVGLPHIAVHTRQTDSPLCVLARVGDRE